MDKADSTEDMNAFAAGAVAAVSEAGQAAPTIKVLEKTATHIKCTYNGTLPVNFYFTGLEWMIEFDQQIIPVDVFVELKHVKMYESKGIHAQFKQDDQEYMPYIVEIKSFKSIESFMVAYGVINAYIFENLDSNCECSDCESDSDSSTDSTPELEVDAEDEEVEESEDVQYIGYNGFPCDTGPEAKVTALVARELTKTNLEHLMIGLLIGALFPFIIRFYNGILFR